MTTAGCQREAPGARRNGGLSRPHKTGPFSKTCHHLHAHHGSLGSAAVLAKALVAQAQRLGACLRLAVRRALQVLPQQRLAPEIGLRSSRK